MLPRSGGGGRTSCDLEKCEMKGKRERERERERERGRESEKHIVSRKAGCISLRTELGRARYRRRRSGPEIITKMRTQMITLIIIIIIMIIIFAILIIILINNINRDHK